MCHQDTFDASGWITWRVAGLKVTRSKNCNGSLLQSWTELQNTRLVKRWVQQQLSIIIKSRKSLWSASVVITQEVLEAC